MVAWTPKMIDQVRRLAKAGLSGGEIAKKMTEELGEEVTSNAIAGLCHRNKIQLLGRKPQNFLEHPPPAAQVAKRRLLVAVKIPKPNVQKGKTVRVKAKLVARTVPKQKRVVGRHTASSIEVPELDPVPTEALVPDIKSSGLRDPARFRATYAPNGETCEFPFGEFGKPGYRLCGEKVEIGCYCRRHALICSPGLVRRLDELGLE